MGILAVGKEDSGKSGLGFRFGGNWNEIYGETTLKYTIFCCSEGTFIAATRANEVAKCVFFCCSEGTFATGGSLCPLGFLEHSLQ